MKTPFQRIMEGLNEAHEAVIHAQSDAAFDGRDWIGLSNADKHRYLQRVLAGYRAVADATPSQPSQERT